VTCFNFVAYLWCVTTAGNISAATSNWWNNKEVTITYMNLLSTSCDEDSIQLICLCGVVLLLQRGWTGSTGQRIWEMTVLMKLRRIRHRISYSYRNHNILRLSYSVFNSFLESKQYVQELGQLCFFVAFYWPNNSQYFLNLLSLHIEELSVHTGGLIL